MENVDCIKNKCDVLSCQWHIVTALTVTHDSIPIFREAKGEKTLKLAVQEPCIQHCRAAVTLIVLFILSVRRSEKDQVSVTLYS